MEHSYDLVVEYRHVRSRRLSAALHLAAVMLIHKYSYSYFGFYFLARPSLFDF